MMRTDFPPPPASAPALTGYIEKRRAVNDADKTFAVPNHVAVEHHAQWTTMNATMAQAEG